MAALGDLHRASMPTQSEREWALLLLGEELEPPTSLIKPAFVRPLGEDILIVDQALATIFKYNTRTRALQEYQLPDRLLAPSALAVAKNGDLLLADAQAGVVLRLAIENRSVIQRYALPGGAAGFRPSGIAVVGSEVWVTNGATHCIEIFAESDGRHLRSLGTRGAGRGEFRFPMGLCVGSEGNVYVADMLNYRVQVLSPKGEWLREIGRAGDCIGCFGRPRDVAVGPDGAVFVSDATSGRIHVFGPDGRALMAFGEPDGGPGALLMPWGVCIANDRPGGPAELPQGFEPLYYVLVAEQLLRPAVRVYAWRKGELARTDSLVAGPAPVSRVESPKAATIQKASNPHWSANGCGDCHAMRDGIPAAIAPGDVNRVCLACHDGLRAGAEAHPIGRLAQTATISTPADWPVLDGRISCLTCHDIRRHCTSTVNRPRANAAMLRGYDAGRAHDYCNTCHHADALRPYNPHVQIDNAGAVREQSCLFCHTTTPPIPPDGARQGQPLLRQDTSQLCLRCHVRHWDVSPLGHVERPISAGIQRNLQRREQAAWNGSPATPLADRTTQAAQRLPLTDDRVTCFTCHNPHQAGLFRNGSPLDMREAATGKQLRMSEAQLCVECHVK